MKQIMYGLKKTNTNHLLCFTTSSNAEGDNTDVTYKLAENWGDTYWLTHTKAHAEQVRDNHTKWYNASYHTPMNPYVGELEVVEVILNY